MPLTAPLASLLALLTAIVVSCTSRINVGLIAIALAWAVGAYAGMPADAVLAGFPASLFMTLAGVTLLFSLAESNGTIGGLAQRLLRLARGRARMVPVLIFCVLPALGIVTTAPAAILLFRTLSRSTGGLP